jgi:hypothetical protein
MAFGAQVYVVVGKSEQECIFRWGSVGNLPKICAVPQAKGKITFAVGDAAIVFSPINAYCATIKVDGAPPLPAGG